MPLIFWKKHWTIRYCYHRCLKILSDFGDKDSPWLTSKSVEIIKDFLTENSIGYEWGSGKSTTWFGERISKLYSIEHDQAWFLEVKVMIKKNKLNNIELRHIPLSISSERYVDGFLDVIDVPDFILVDGKIRDQCAIKAVSLVKAGGIIIVDNINRYLPNDSKSPQSLNKSSDYASSEWKCFDELTANWEKIWTSDGITDTCLYFKPLS